MTDRTIRDLLEDAVERLSEAGIESPRRNAEWLLSDALMMSRAGLYAETASGVPRVSAGKFERMLRRRLQLEPLQYILGHTDFYGLRLDVGPAVLIPRPETEELVAAALECITSAEAPRVLDVGTGSGCIALAVKHERPDAAVFACDVSSEALAVARGNARAHDLDVELFEADVLGDDFTTRAPKRLDLVISNPPYVTGDEMDTLPEDVKRHEPHLALFAVEEPLVFYRRLARIGLDLLSPGGWMALETHADFGSDVMHLLKGGGYREVMLRRDLADRDRIVLAKR